MKILISNDDGIDSKGILKLAEALKRVGDVIVVAPRTEQSAVGHAITMKIPLRVTEYYHNGDRFGYAVEGTPADCVKMGIRNIMKESPDIVVSGINHGSNTAISIVYSGTVSAAREAAIMNVPAIAISVADHRPKNFEFACKLAAELVKQVVDKGLPNGTCLNVNVPDLPESEIRGVLITKQGKSKWDDSYEERVDPYGNKYYWLTGNLIETEDNTIESDQNAVKNGYAAITPIHFDLTDYTTYNEMKNWKIERAFNISKTI